MCRSGNGGLAGQKALRARCNSTVEVLADGIEQHWRCGIAPRPRGRCGCSRPRAASDAKRARSCGLPLTARVHMKPALLLLLMLPPPAAGPRMLAGLHRAGARLAADGDEAAGVQRIHRHVVLGDIGGELLRRPVGDGVDLHEPALLIPGGKRDVGALLGMLAADAGDPALGTFQLAVQRPDFAHLAAGLAVVDRLAEAEHAVAGDESLDLRGFRRDEPDAQAIANLGKLDGLKHLGKQAAGVEGENIDVGAGLGDGIEDRLIVETEAGREDDPSLHRPPYFGDALGEAFDFSKPRVQFLGLALRGIAAERLRVAEARLIEVADAGQRPLPGFDVVGIGDLGSVEARAQQKRSEVRDQIADGPDLALEAVTLAQEHGERMPAAVAESGEADGDGPARRRGGGESRGVGRRFEQRIVVARAWDEIAGVKIKQRHREPP